MYEEYRGIEKTMNAKIKGFFVQDALSFKARKTLLKTFNKAIGEIIGTSDQFTIDKFQKIAPQVDAGLYLVPKVIDEE